LEICEHAKSNAKEIIKSIGEKKNIREEEAKKSSSKGKEEQFESRTEDTFEDQFRGERTASTAQESSARI